MEGSMVSDLKGFEGVLRQLHKESLKMWREADLEGGRRQAYCWGRVEALEEALRICGPVAVGPAA